MQRKFVYLFLLGAIAASLISFARPASADAIAVDVNGTVLYTTWQPAWDRYEFDRHHVILGEVVGFEPYRVQLQRHNGRVQNVDLKNGTVILPTGSTPTPGERVAVVGYYSHGTFIVNRLIVR